MIKVKRFPYSMEWVKDFVPDVWYQCPPDGTCSHFLIRRSSGEFETCGWYWYGEQSHTLRPVENPPRLYRCRVAAQDWAELLGLSRRDSDSGCYGEWY
jgi:hypothetical protein